MSGVLALGTFKTKIVGSCGDNEYQTNSYYTVVGFCYLSCYTEFSGPTQGIAFWGGGGRRRRGEEPFL